MAYKLVPDFSNADTLHLFLQKTPDEAAGLSIILYNCDGICDAEIVDESMAPAAFAGTTFGCCITIVMCVAEDLVGWKETIEKFARAFLE